METVKYLCEFFFGNFWHWLGLVIVLCSIFPYGLFSIGNKITEITNKDKEKEEE